MAVVSSHTLNGVDGTHAGGIAVSLRNLSSGEMLFDTAMDRTYGLRRLLFSGRTESS